MGRERERETETMETMEAMVTDTTTAKKVQCIIENVCVQRERDAPP